MLLTCVQLCSIAHLSTLLLLLNKYCYCCITTLFSRHILEHIWIPIGTINAFQMLFKCFSTVFDWCSNVLRTHLECRSFKCVQKASEHMLKESIWKAFFEKHPLHLRAYLRKIPASVVLWGHRWRLAVFGVFKCSPSMFRGMRAVIRACKLG